MSDLIKLVENRYMCSVLDEMRNCVETSNFSGLSGLIEEAQSYANRMENGLANARSASVAAYKELAKDKPNVKKAKKSLRKRWKNLKRGF